METKNVNERNMDLSETANETVSIGGGIGSTVDAGKATEMGALKKRSHVMGVIAKVIEIINYVGAGLSAVAAIVCAFIPNYMELFVSLEETKPFFPEDAWEELSQAISQLGGENLVLAASCLATAVSCVVYAVIFRYVRKTFEELEHGDTPFTETLTNRVKIIGIILTVFVLIGYGIFDALIAAALMLTMYTVFRFGCLLQTESDETV